MNDRPGRFVLRTLPALALAVVLLASPIAMAKNPHGPGENGKPEKGGPKGPCERDPSQCPPPPPPPSRCEPLLAGVTCVPPPPEPVCIPDSWWSSDWDACVPEPVRSTLPCGIFTHVVFLQVFECLPE